MSVDEAGLESELHAGPVRRPLGLTEPVGGGLVGLGGDLGTGKALAVSEGLGAAPVVEAEVVAGQQTAASGPPVVGLRAAKRASLLRQVSNVVPVEAKTA